jgi:hypothetical protein
MKTKIFVLLLTIIFLSFLSCKKDTVKKYFYNTGELWIEETLIDQKHEIYFDKIYNKKGFLEGKGNSDKNGLYQGIWKFYYSDGKLRWRGKYKDSNRDMPDSIWKNISNRSFIDIEGHPRILKVGQKYKVRTYIEGIDTDTYIVTYNNYKRLEKNKEDPERFPYCITPNKAGIIDILYLYPNSDGDIIVEPHCLKFRYVAFRIRVEN